MVEAMAAMAMAEAMAGATAVAKAMKGNGFPGFTCCTCLFPGAFREMSIEFVGLGLWQQINSLQVAFEGAGCSVGSFSLLGC